MRGQVAPVTCVMLVVASEDNGVKDGLSKAVQGGSGDDVGQLSVVTVGKGADAVLAVSTGLVADEATSVEDGAVLVLAGTAVVAEGAAGGASGSGADAADVIKSRADVGRLSSDKMVAGRVSVNESSQATGGEAVGREDSFGGAGSGDASAVMIAAGSRADVDWPGSGLRVEAQSEAGTLAQYE